MQLVFNIDGLIPLMLAVMVATMKRHMLIAILKDELGRAPTPAELCYYENELWLWELNRWWQDRVAAYKKIDRLVWGNG